MSRKHSVEPVSFEEWDRLHAAAAEVLAGRGMHLGPVSEGSAAITRTRDGSVRLTFDFKADVTGARPTLAVAP